MLVAEALIELGALVLDLLARRVVGADEEVADDGLLRIAQRGHRDDGGETTAVLADLGELVDVFDPARGLEGECFANPAAMGMPNSVLNAAARVTSSPWSWRSAALVVFTTSAAA